jgi:ferredoxin
METIKKIIRLSSLEKLYHKLSETNKVYAPTLSANNKVEYKYNPDYKEVKYDHIQSTLSVKNVVFPKVENLFKFEKTKSEKKIIDIDIEKIPSVVLWGSHPCDNAAYDILQSIFCWEIKDEFFVKRLEKLVVIGLSCHQSDEYCFCTSVGLSPDSKVGSDILLTKLKGGDYVAEILTEKGKAVYDANASLFEDYKEEETQVAQLSQLFNQEQVTEKLKDAFEHPFWVANSLRCIGCGACAFVCPTCACFDIQDESHGKDGIRYRSWDTCGIGLFTLHTSGHNPREVQSQRWRQRILHKFSYMPTNNKTIGCVGCGRCSRGCPVDMNIAEQLQELQNI